LQNTALTTPEYLKLDEESRTRCAGQVARFLNELHSIDLEQAEKCRIPQINYREKYTDLLERIRETQFRVLEKADFEDAENELEFYLESVDAVNFQPVLLHGDLSPDHVLFDKSSNHVTSIIDFGDMMIGDAAWDFLWIYEDYGTDFFARAIAEYVVKDKKKFIERIVRFSIFETIAWISECLTNGEQDLAEAVEHLRALKSIAVEINSFSDNPPAN
jgi:aminoglycoside 2''-phosphotransferase